MVILFQVVCKYGTEVVQTLKNETGDGGNVTFSNNTRKFPLENCECTIICASLISGSFYKWILQL